MPAIWRPNVGRVLPDVDVEVKATEEDATNKGTKRKRALPQRDGVKYREQVCAVRGALSAVRWCINLRARSCNAAVSAREVALFLQGVWWVGGPKNLRARSLAL